MKKRSWRHLTAVGAVSVTIAAGVLMPAAVAHAATGTTYYVNASTGSDSASGSSTQPWKSLTKVDATTFQPGDTILFADGQSWSGQLWPKGSGTSASNITIGEYGSGALPKIMGGGTVADAVKLWNQQYWTIQDLDVSNAAPSTGTAGANLGDFRGIHIGGDDGQQLNHFLINGVNVHDVTGEVNWVSGSTSSNKPGINFDTGWDGSKNTGGIVFETGVADITNPGSTATTLNDITVENSAITNTSFAGITVKQYEGDGSGAVATGWGERTSASDTAFAPHTNVSIHNNYITQVGTAYGADGIYLTAAKNADLYDNVIDHVGTSGIESNETDSVTIQHNEIFGTTKKAGGGDSNAIDTDIATTDQLVQYNYSYGNGEGMLIYQQHFGDSIWRYNVVANSVGTSFHLNSANGATAQVYNNTVLDQDGSIDYGASTGSVVFTNNVFASTASTVAIQTTSNVTYNNNLYSGFSAPTADSNAFTGSPAFANATLSAPTTGVVRTTPSLSSADGLALTTLSAAIGNGLTMPSNGGEDYDGNTLYNGNPDLGAFEYSAAPYVNDHSFNAVATGALPNGADNLNVSSSGGSVTVTARPSGGKELFLSRTAGSGTTSVSESFSTPLTGTVSVDSEVERSSGAGSSSDYFALPYVYGSTGAPAVSVAFSGGNIVAYSGTSLKTLQAYTPGHWYVIREVINVAAQTYSLYIDGSKALSNAALRSSLDGVARVQYYSTGSNTGSVYLDNLRVAQGNG